MAALDTFRLRKIDLTDRLNLRAEQSRLEQTRPDPKTLRRQAGSWLKGLREKAGLTQADVAEKLGLRYYTFISQVEGGHGRVPSYQMPGWADALGVNKRTMAFELLRFYEPELFFLLFVDGLGPVSEA